MAEEDKERSKESHDNELQEENRESAPHQMILLPLSKWEKQMGINQPHGHNSHRGLHQGFKSLALKNKSIICCLIKNQARFCCS